jgi:hypothetical protein
MSQRSWMMWSKVNTRYECPTCDLRNVYHILRTVNGVSVFTADPWMSGTNLRNGSSVMTCSRTTFAGSFKFLDCIKYTRRLVQSTHSKKLSSVSPCLIISSISTMYCDYRCLPPTLRGHEGSSVAPWTSCIFAACRRLRQRGWRI